MRLQVNRIGYEAKTVTVTVTANQTVTADVTLDRRPLALRGRRHGDGAQKKAEIANTIASIDVSAKADETAPTRLATAVRPGRRRASISSGAAGGGSRIRIRGQSSLSLGNNPVVYVDGIKVNSDVTTGSATRSSRFDDINPDEIENIDILKGPAAATLYGTEAANGVINITTKKGKVGQTRWTFFGEQAASKDQEAGHYRDL